MKLTDFIVFFLILTACSTQVVEDKPSAGLPNSFTISICANSPSNGADRSYRTQLRFIGDKLIEGSSSKEVSDVLGREFICRYAAEEGVWKLRTVEQKQGKENTCNSSIILTSEVQSRIQVEKDIAEGKLSPCSNGCPSFGSCYTLEG